MNISSNKLVSWDEMDGGHGMLILNDFATVQAAVESSDDYAKMLKRWGMDDPKKIVTTPLTVGYLGGNPLHGISSLINKRT
ncbi:hypothetical protein [Peribacillus simplex]|uniref:hypothetical protein n=1 Tax=Peribacillus simplex TaxID=1478 RepID=UPI003CFDF06C